MIVRDATLDDVEALYPILIADIASDARLGTLDAEDVVQHLANMLMLPSVHILLAEKEDGIIGAAAITVSPALGSLGPVVATEVMWHVSAAHTKSKVGSKLMRALEARAKEAGAEVMVLQIAPDAHAKRLANAYKSRGYEELRTTFTKRL